MNNKKKVKYDFKDFEYFSSDKMRRKKSIWISQIRSLRSDYVSMLIIELDCVWRGAEIYKCQSI